MQAVEILKQGDVEATLSAVKNSVRDDPANAENRTFLFQLLAVAGDWDRALNQLNVAGELEAKAFPMVQTYREALGCEALREQVFSGERSPLVFGDPEQWIALALEAVKLDAQGKHAEAAAMRADAYEQAPAIPGAVNGEPFEWLADADSRIGPFFEAIVNGGYYWIPMHRVASMTVEPPEDLRDLVWVPAQFSWANGGQSIALLPVRYPNTQRSSNDVLRLARRTEWEEKGEGSYFGLGQRMLATDSADYPLLDVREVKFEVEATGEDAG